MKESVKRTDQSVTELLLKWGSGDKGALDELIPLVYDELRKLAASYLRRKPGAHKRFGHKPEVELLALDDALNELATTNPQHSRVIELRFFGGLTIDETADVMNLSHATTERYWSFARAWLRRELVA